MTRLLDMFIKIPFSWIDHWLYVLSYGQMHFVYSFHFISRDMFPSLDKFPMKQTLKAKACKTAIPLLLFFKHWSPGAHPTSGLTLEMKKNTKPFWEIATLFRIRFKCSNVIKCLKNHGLWGSLQFWACSPVLWTYLSAIHEMQRIKMQFWEDVAALMCEENKEKLLEHHPGIP